MNEKDNYAHNNKYQKTGLDTRTLGEGNNCTGGTEGNIPQP
jgi:hypothetical protein